MSLSQWGVKTQYQETVVDSDTEAVTPCIPGEAAGGAIALLEKCK